jgi:LysR family hydrogen peroxide-inducible transcriptional activator
VTGPDLEEMRLYHEPFRVAVPRGHPLCEAERIPLQALRDLDILLLADGHCLTDQVRELCDWGGSRGARGRADGGAAALGRDDLRASSLETLLQLDAVGFGLTLVPELARLGARPQGAAVSMRPLVGKRAGRTVRLEFRRGYPLHRVLQAFAQILRASLPDCVNPIGVGA